MTTLAQPAVSTQPVQVQVLATAGGSAYDPTADTVQMAFVAQSFPPASPQSSDWHTASWETDGTGASATYWASCLVGPENGGISLARGTYVCWVKVTDDPAVPALPGPVLNIT